MGNTYSNKELKDLVFTIDKLSKNEHIEIYKILKKYYKQFTENSNGIFINLSLLDNNIINDLLKFVNFRIGSNQYLNKLEENRKKNESYLNKNIINNHNTDINIIDTNKEDDNQGINQDDNQGINQDDNQGINQDKNENTNNKYNIDKKNI